MLLADIVKFQFKLSLYGSHGIYHWQRVEKIGLFLAKKTKANTNVIKLFALLHDAKRVNEYEDSSHGKKAAEFVQYLYQKNHLKISAVTLSQLIFACEHHSNPKIKSDDITIQTCWDSDRLDLWRIGIKPDIKYLNTEFAKTPEAINFSNKLFNSYPN